MEKEKITCACGHVNPYGTKLCEKCGRPLTEEEKNTKVVDMRYDGKAIRSKTYNRSIVDKVWNFFSSVKVGIALIIITLLAASVGTFLPQEFYVNVGTLGDKGAYYENTYGTIGKIYYALGLSDLYSSWWFQILVGMLGISIIVASIDRGIPLHKSLTNQRVKRHESFMKRQRIVAQGEVEDNEQTLATIEKEMKALKYKVRRDGDALLAEKNRFSRYGPYINHVGLIVFLTGVSLRVIPGLYVDESMLIREGETIEVMGMPGYFLENDKFILEMHENDKDGLSGEQVRQGVNVVAKNFQTNAKLYKQPEGALPGDTDNLELVKEYSIRVNHPLQYDGYSLYQMDYRLDELYTMTFDLVNKETEDSYGQVTVQLDNPEAKYDLGNGSSVEILNYTPDFAGFKDGVPQTNLPVPNNPAFVFKMVTPDTPEGETSFVAIRNTLEPLGENKNMMKFASATTRNSSGLTIHKDSTIPIIAVGGIIFMIGVAIGSYWNHRRLWVQATKDGKIILAAHTNKNWFGMKKELDIVTQAAHLPAYVDQLDLNDSEEKQEGDEA
ncbi:Cytochrome c biogenesis protein CcsB [Metalysinibacillus saudimassiliensis]|uniref:Cytochrome c biogenesis protein CcsB n=1 Tax=Metalysinibacillus saudimassiliensis TaxID=1461583 RepID=A0A078MH44_9BACL|nr:Cytochrome c biogenesis protein CcsB [Metalysinibacillus saudimassiliensis]